MCHRVQSGGIRSWAIFILLRQGWPGNLDFFWQLRCRSAGESSANIAFLPPALRNRNPAGAARAVPDGAGSTRMGSGRCRCGVGTEQRVVPGTGAASRPGPYPPISAGLWWVSIQPHSLAAAGFGPRGAVSTVPIQAGARPEPAAPTRKLGGRRGMGQSNRTEVLAEKENVPSALMPSR